VLEQAVELGGRVRSRQFRAWFRTLLGEAYLSDNRIEEARDLILEALELSTDIKYLLGVGFSKRALGRIAQAQGALEESEEHLGEALQTVVSAGARFETGCTRLDLAALAHAGGDREAAAAHLKEAHSLFEDLHVPKYVERAEQLAKDFGIHPSNQIAN
jgi:tetratricopeptide (TPR) repeat protein